MKEIKHFKSNISDTNGFSAFKHEPVIYPTINQDGSYRYENREIDSGNALIEQPQTKYVQVIMLISWIVVVIILVVGMVLISYRSRQFSANQFQNPLMQQTNSKPIIVSKLGRPFGCSFYLNKDVTNGLFIEQIQRNGPADQAGLLVRDQILSLDNIKVETVRDVMDIFRKKQSGDKVTIEYSRDGEKAETTLVLELP